MTGHMKAWMWCEAGHLRPKAQEPALGWRCRSQYSWARCEERPLRGKANDPPWAAGKLLLLLVSGLEEVQHCLKAPLFQQLCPGYAGVEVERCFSATLSQQLLP